MKTFKDWGLRVRKDKTRNYYALWMELETYRMDLGPEIKLPYDRSEFYDVSVTTRCNAECSFCYVSAGHGGQDFQDICETWERWMSTFPDDTPVDLREDEVLKDILTSREELGLSEISLRVKVLRALQEGRRVVYTEKPCQIALGSTGEPTIHPDLPRFLETVYMSGVVPNYTTNGVYLSPQVLEATRNFVGGVAVSYGNKLLRDRADSTIETLLKSGDCKVMIHHLISDRASVDDVLEAMGKWGEDIHYHVLLPLKAHGRSTQEMTEDAYLYLTEVIKEKGLQRLAFGAWFLPFLQKYPGSLEVYDYPTETYSSNILLKGGKVIITPSSYDLTPKMII